MERQPKSALNTVKLKRLIKTKFKTQIAFAQATKLPKQSISQYLLGQREPTLTTMRLFSDLLDVPIDELVKKDRPLAGQGAMI